MDASRYVAWYDKDLEHSGKWRHEIKALKQQGFDMVPCTMQELTVKWNDTDPEKREKHKCKSIAYIQKGE